MKRHVYTGPFVNRTGSFLECPKVEAFLSDIYAVCQKHGMALYPDAEERHDGRLLVIGTKMGSGHWLVAAAAEKLANAGVIAETFPEGGLKL